MSSSVVEPQMPHCLGTVAAFSFDMRPPSGQSLSSCSGSQGHPQRPSLARWLHSILWRFQSARWHSLEQYITHEHALHLRRCESSTPLSQVAFSQRLGININLSLRAWRSVLSASSGRLFSEGPEGPRGPGTVMGTGQDSPENILLSLIQELKS
eukprot:TRINITY_DN14325_c0_g1_i1.p2 TRINITY_DN14325_c0_g1~~TRINITY_DN14325_c0_g1_i1.p2  ORF type:complete len:154 (-),score=10.43 TRINITY_DN14325_c0_g1_i1:79-540(-)